MDDRLSETISSYLPELIAIRHDIHKHPETAFEEHRTAALVADTLKKWGIDVVTGIAGTGVIGTLTGTKSGSRAIALRADMDALDIVECTNLPYASAIEGKMHACGHDGHTTMLLGAARYLSEHRDFPGTVHFIFQPAEEKGGGGLCMIEDDLFQRFPCDAVYGLHNERGWRWANSASAPARCWLMLTPGQWFSKEPVVMVPCRIVQQIRVCRCRWGIF